jgi:hypothetical protein
LPKAHRRDALPLAHVYIDKKSHEVRTELWWDTVSLIADAYRESTDNCSKLAIAELERAKLVHDRELLSAWVVKVLMKCRSAQSDAVLAGILRDGPETLRCEILQGIVLAHHPELRDAVHECGQVGSPRVRELARHVLGAVEE